MSTHKPKVGVIGVGAIAEAFITGLACAGEHRADVLLSPRNRESANGLAGKYAFVTVAPDNQAVCDGSDMVFLAVTPQVAEAVIAPLSFRPDHRIVSLIATYSLDRIAPLVAPATKIVRATPLPPIAKRRGAITLFPADPAVEALVKDLGTVLTLPDEAQMDAIWAVTGTMGSYFGLLDRMAHWLSERGVSAGDARAYLGATFHALASTALEAGDTDFATLARDHSTPGGLNEQAHRELAAAGWTDLMAQALDLIESRIAGRATLDDGLSPDGRRT